MRALYSQTVSSIQGLETLGHFENVQFFQKSKLQNNCSNAIRPVLIKFNVVM